MIDIGSLIDNYSKESLERIVSLSHSMAELVSNLGYKTKHGKNHETVQKRLNQLNISTSHFNEKMHKRTITEIDVFCKNSTVSQNTLRRFFLKKKDIEYKCSECGVNNMWNGLPLTLQLDHKDGDNTNNLLDNLRWLCPNCHSQTKTFAGKNTKAEKEKRKYYCIDCGKEISRNSSRCHKCSSDLRREIQLPTKNELECLLKSHNGNFTSVANIYNTSTSTIRRWCEHHELSTHSKDYKASKPKKKIRQPCIVYEVEQIDMFTGDIVASFKSIREAERITGIHHITEASNPNHKRKSAGGYYWHRKDILNQYKAN